MNWHIRNPQRRTAEESPSSRVQGCSQHATWAQAEAGSSTSMLLIGAALAALLLIMLFLILRGLGRRQQLEMELDTIHTDIAQRSRYQALDIQSLREQNEQNRAEIAKLKSLWPTEEQVRAELGRYPSYAVETGVQITRIELRTESVEQPPGPAIEQDSVAILVQQWQIDARGDLTSLMRMLARIASGPYRTFRLENIVIRTDDMDATTGAATAMAQLTTHSLAVR